MHCFNTILHNKDFKSNLFWLNWREPQGCLFLSIYQCSSSTGISLKVTVSDNTQVPFCHRIHSENAAQYPFCPIVLNYVNIILVCYWKNTLGFTSSWNMEKWGMRIIKTAWLPLAFIFIPSPWHTQVYFSPLEQHTKQRTAVMHINAAHIQRQRQKGMRKVWQRAAKPLFYITALRISIL